LVAFADDYVELGSSTSSGFSLSSSFFLSSPINFCRRCG